MKTRPLFSRDVLQVYMLLVLLAFGWWFATRNAIPGIADLVGKQNIVILQLKSNAEQLAQAQTALQSRIAEVAAQVEELHKQADSNLEKIQEIQAELRGRKK